MITAGQRAESLNCGWAVALEDKPVVRNEYINVQFESTGCVKKVLTVGFDTGNIRDSIFDICVGDILKSTTDGNFEILKIESSRNITVRFLKTGNIVGGIQKDALVRGYIKDRVLKEDIQYEKYVEQEDKAAARYRAQLAAEEAKHVYAEEQAAKRLRSADRKAAKLAQSKDYNDNKIARDIEYRENAIKVMSSDIADKGENPNDLNIDFKDRHGKWVLNFGQGTKFYHTRLGRYYNNMTQRAGRKDCYFDVAMSDSFKDPQKFCDWAVQQPGWGEGYSLDKDLLGEHSREYGADTCCFIPHCVNTAIVRHGMKKVAVKRSDGWIVKLGRNHHKIILGVYPTHEGGVSAYRKYCEDYVKFLAEKYKNKISERAYQALFLWKA